MRAHTAHGFIAAIVALSMIAAASCAAPQPAAPIAPVTATLGTLSITNHGLVGVGRLPASLTDAFGDSFGSVSGLQITEWTRTGDGRYAGTFNILPDRGYNAGGFYADYASRINHVRFSFAPYDGIGPIGGATAAARLMAQRQIAFVLPITGVQLTYDDPARATSSSTTGLDPGAGVGTLFGRLVPYVTTYTGPATADEGAAAARFEGIDALAIDAEALALRPDGSGYVGDEYGPHVYVFDASGKITGVIVPPPAFLPHTAGGTRNFSSTTVPVNGRRPNQGFEGVALSPDGRRLFVMLQSATVQDGDPAANNHLARHTRLLVYDVSATPAPTAPIGAYALTLPVFAASGRGGTPDRTAAQSEIVALDSTRLLILARDSNGLGSANRNASVFKRVLLADLGTGAPTNFVGDTARHAEGGRITTAPGVLDPAIAPVPWVDAIDLLDPIGLAKFNLVLDDGASPVSKFTLGEKWEGMALVPALDPARPDDHFLFVANDNDFLTSNGRMRGPGGGTIRYDSFAGHPAGRVPPAVPGAGPPDHDNDTVFLVYRLTLRTSR